jgi:hypothetical protein
MRNDQVVFQGGTRTKAKHRDGSKVWTDEFFVTFHRTLRLPEDGRTHALPPSLGHFPVKQVDDYKDRVPAAWAEHGGIFLPMWQREALWLAFQSKGRPCVVKVAAGKINAVSGKPWTAELTAGESRGEDPEQDYMVAPPQPWLDGFNTGDGEIRQFVAMPLGQGYTVEKQVTGREEFGGIQLMVVPAKEGALENYRHNPYVRGGLIMSDSQPLDFAPSGMSFMGGYDEPVGSAAVYNCSVGEVKTSGGILRSRGMQTNSLRSRVTTKAAEMGLGAGGKMRQKIYPDPHGIDTWDVSSSGRLYVHLVNSQMYEQITGEKPPVSPIDAQTYARHGYPWFDLWDEGMGDVKASGTLAGVKSIGQMDVEKGMEGQQDDSPVEEKNVHHYKIKPAHSGQQVRDGKW